MERLISALGFVAMIGLCYLLSNNRSKINWRLVIWGSLLQILFAVLILNTEPGRKIFEGANTAVNKVLEASNKGTSFVFGSWGDIMHDVGHAGEISAQHRFENFHNAGYQMASLRKVRLLLIGEPSLKELIPGTPAPEKPPTLDDFKRYLTNSQNKASLQSALVTTGSEKTHLVVLLKSVTDEHKKQGEAAKALAEQHRIPVLTESDFQQLLTTMGPRPFMIHEANFVFFPQVMGTIILVSGLMSLLFYFGIIQLVVRGMAWVMIKTMGTSGAESLAAAANVFVGQTEAPIVIGPYVSSMTKAELLSLMCGGMATIAGGVMVAYVALGVEAGHLLAASVMSAPAALLVAKMLYPEVEEPKTKGKVKLEVPIQDSNAIEAVARGCSDGLRLALNVMAMLIGFIALIAVLNQVLGWVTFGYLSFEKLMTWLFIPFAWLMGVTSSDIPTVAQLLGTKTVLNEFIAYIQLSEVRHTLDPRSIVITTYALCGFANFSSIGIQIGGISVLAESRRGDLAKLGMKALIGGTIACYLTACIAGVLTPVPTPAV